MDKKMSWMMKKMQLSYRCSELTVIQVSLYQLHVMSACYACACTTCYVFVMFCVVQLHENVHVVEQVDVHSTRPLVTFLLCLVHRS